MSDFAPKLEWKIDVGFSQGKCRMGAYTYAVNGGLATGTYEDLDHARLLVRILKEIARAEAVHFTANEKAQRHAEER